MDSLLFYPYRFRSILKEKLWGGRDLELVLNKPLPPHKMIGEAWELSDREADMSMVDNGAHEGVALRTLLDADRRAILGPLIARIFPERFPLLVKYIDAHETLSLQVHPDDTYAMENENGEWGKMEAWYIIHAEPGAFIFRGVVPGTTRESFIDLLYRKMIRKCLQRLPVAAGDVVFIPPGCVHATGRGILFCEVQQNSDLTYRVYDWDRVDFRGVGRGLHLDRALDVIDWSLLEREEKGLLPTVSGDGLLLECPKFGIEHVSLKAGKVSTAQVTQRFHIVCVIGGHGKIIHPHTASPVTTIRKGETYLIPSALESYEITTEETCSALRFFVPLPGD